MPRSTITIEPKIAMLFFYTTRVAKTNPVYRAQVRRAVSPQLPIRFRSSDDTTAAFQL